MDIRRGLVEARAKRPRGAHDAQRAFTMVELLMVIAIIGVLASIVIVALTNTRAKARDARIRGSMQQLRVLAEDVRDSNTGNSYVSPCDVKAMTATGVVSGPPCAADATVAQSMNIVYDDLQKQSGAAPTVEADSDSFCVSSPLNAGPAAFFCSDSDGRTGVDIVCTAGSATCTP